MRDEGEAEASQGIALVEACLAWDDGVTIEEVGSGAIAGLN